MRGEATHKDRGGRLPSQEPLPHWKNEEERLRKQREEFEAARARALRSGLSPKVPTPINLSEGSSVAEWKEALCVLADDAKRHTQFLKSEVEALSKRLAESGQKGATPGEVWNTMEDLMADAKTHAQYVAEQSEALLKGAGALSGPINVDQNPQTTHAPML